MADFPDRTFYDDPIFYDADEHKELTQKEIVRLLLLCAKGRAVYAESAEGGLQVYLHQEANAFFNAARVASGGTLKGLLPCRMWDQIQEES